MREIKVQLYSGEDDNYVELWKTVEEIEGKHRYYGRYTYGDEGTWYSVCDPLGYCELNAPIADDVMFICCDENGNEVIFCHDDNRISNIKVRQNGSYFTS